MRTITTISLALFVSLSLSLAATPEAHACGGVYSRTPERTVSNVAYAYLAEHEPQTDPAWGVDSVSITEDSARAVILWNGRLHTLTLVSRDGAWSVTRWNAQALPAEPVTSRS